MARIDDLTKQQRAERIWLTVKKHARGITEAEITQELNMGRRTVNNYLRDLEYEGKVFKNGRLWFPLNLRGTRLRSFELSPEEAVALYLGVRLLAKQHDKRNEPAETALLKLAQVLKSDAGVGDEIEQAARELAQRPVKEGYPPVFRDIVRGYIYRKKVRIAYKPLGQEDEFETTFSTYLLEPSAVGFSTYLIGHSSIVDELRSYKLERVQSVQLTNEDYEIPADFDGLAILRNAWNIVSGKNTGEVILRFSPKVRERVLETQWHPSQRTGDDPEKEGWLRWSAQVASTLDMLPWIRGWGADVEVLKPDELQQQIMLDLKRNMQNYHLSISRDNIDDRLLQLWGKTQGDLFHPALYHMLDVGHIAQWLLSERASPRWRRVLSRALNAQPETLREWLPHVIALHDLGKLSPLFQMLNRAQLKRLRNGGFLFPKISRKKLKTLWHPIVGHELLVSSPSFADWPPGLTQVIKGMVIGHHGSYPRISREMAVDLQNLHENSEWEHLRHRALEILSGVFLIKKPDPWPNPENRSAAIGVLTGFCILCDWLGSDAAYFSPQPATPLLKYITDSRSRAFERVQTAGLFQASTSDAPTRFHALFGFSPRPLQTVTENIPENMLRHPLLAIIEAPTGEGKTEAALLLARRIAALQGTDEMYVALPTMATSNAMHKRVQEHITKHLHLSGDVRLVHGQSFLQEDDLLLKPLDNLPDEQHPAEDWFSPKKKALLAPFGVGTIDQTELTALNVRHNMLRMIGLAGKVVILDEVHAYDTYMMSIIKRMVEWLSALGSSIILLSATLPQKHRRGLADAFATGAGAQITDDYPNLFLVNAQGETYASARPIGVDALNRRTIHLDFLDFEDSQAVEKAHWLLKQVGGGGCVAWMSNTVQRAQDIFRELKKIAPPDVDLDLLHARFPLDTREQLEDSIVEKYGKAQNGKRPSKGIVIGTQVLEQSLDLDFDLLVSDLAPIDLLLQRIGRLHRHDRQGARGPHTQPRCYINNRITEGDKAVYHPYLLQKTQEVLAGRRDIQLPESYRPLVDSVYGEETLPEMQTDADRLEEEAKTRLIAPPFPNHPFYMRSNRVPFIEDEDGTSWLIAKTRWGRESITVIPLQRVGDFAIPALADSSPAVAINRKADRPIQLRLLRRGLRISNPRLLKYLKEQKTLPLFRSSLLKQVYPLWVEPCAENEHVFTGIPDLPKPVYLHPLLGLVFGDCRENADSAGT